MLALIWFIILRSSSLLSSLSSLWEHTLSLSLTEHQPLQNPWSWSPALAAAPWKGHLYSYRKIDVISTIKDSHLSQIRTHAAVVLRSGSRPQRTLLFSLWQRHGSRYGLWISDLGSASSRDNEADLMIWYVFWFLSWGLQLGFCWFSLLLDWEFCWFFFGFCATVWVLTAVMWGEREKQMGQDREERP